MTAGSKNLVQEPAHAAFREFVRAALDARSLQTSEWTEFYLVGLLVGLAEASPALLSRSLGPDLLSAQQLPPEQRFSQLKGLADTSLVLTGLFIDYVEEALPATDYFFSIGSSAYLHLGEFDDPRFSGAGGFTETFQELGERFEDFAAALAWIADRELFRSSEHTMSVYRRWLRSRSRRDESRLITIGIIPADTDPDNVH
jgi:hypothetical protein